MLSVTAIQLYDAAVTAAVLTEAQTAGLFSAWTVREHDGAIDERQARVKLGHALAAEVQVQRVVRIERRLETATGVTTWREWWRIRAVSGPAIPESPDAELTVVLRPRWADLGDEVVLPSTADSVQEGSTKVVSTDETPEDALARLLVLSTARTPDGQALYVVGSVSPQLADVRCDVTVVVASFEAMIDRIADSAEAQWAVRCLEHAADPLEDRFAIDLVFVNPWERRQRLLLEAPSVSLSLSGHAGGREVGPMRLTRSVAAESIVTEVVPVSRDEADVFPSTITIEGALWRPGESDYDAGADTTTLGLYRHRPTPGAFDLAAAVCWETDALAGLELVELDGAERRLPIVASEFPHLVVFDGDVAPFADTVRLEYADGTLPRSMVSPSLAALYGRVQRALRYPVHPEPNLVERRGTTADLSVWVDGQPVGVYAENGALAAETTQRADVQHGRASARFVLSGSATALAGDDLDVAVTENYPNPASTSSLTETASWTDGTDQDGVAFRVVASAETSLVAKGEALASSLARLRMRFKDAGGSVLETHTDSVYTNTTRQLSLEKAAPVGTRTIEVEVYVQASADANSFASALITGVTFERLAAPANTTPAIVLYSGGLPSALAAYVSLRVTEGAVYVQVEDVDKTVVSYAGELLRQRVEVNPALGSDSPFSFAELQGEGLEAPYALVIRLASPQATVVVDAVTIIDGLNPVEYEPAMGPEALWEQGCMDMARRVAQAVDEIDGEYIDLAAYGTADPARPVRPGDLAQVATPFGTVRAFVTDVVYQEALGGTDPRWQVRLGQAFDGSVIKGEAAGSVDVVLSGLGTGLAPGGFIGVPTQLCGADQRSSIYAVDERAFEIGATAGFVVLTYEMFEGADAARMLYDGVEVAATGGAVTGDGYLVFYYDPQPGDPSTVTVEIDSGAQPGGWEYRISCPDPTWTPPSNEEEGDHCQVAPVQLEPTVSASDATFSIELVEGASRYVLGISNDDDYEMQLLLDLDELTIAEGVGSYTVTLPDGTYTARWKVECGDTTGWEDLIPDWMPCGQAPTLDTATGASDGTITIEWTLVDGIETYVAGFSADDDGTYEKQVLLTPEGGGSETHYTVSGTTATATVSAFELGETYTVVVAGECGDTSGWVDIDGPWEEVPTSGTTRSDSGVLLADPFSALSFETVGGGAANPGTWVVNWQNRRGDVDLDLVSSGQQAFSKVDASPVFNNKRAIAVTPTLLGQSCLETTDDWATIVGSGARRLMVVFALDVLGVEHTIAASVRQSATEGETDGWRLYVDSLNRLTFERLAAGVASSVVRAGALSKDRAYCAELLWDDATPDVDLILDGTVGGTLAGAFSTPAGPLRIGGGFDENGAEWYEPPMMDGRFALVHLLAGSQATDATLTAALRSSISPDFSIAFS